MTDKTDFTNVPTAIGVIKGPDGKVIGTSPTIFGTAPAGSSVSVYDHGKLIGTTTASFDGKWILLSGHLKAGLYGYTAVSTGSTGEQQSNVATFSITNDPIGYSFPIKSFDNVSLSSANQSKVQLVFDAVANAFSTVFNGSAVIPIDVSVVTTTSYAATAGAAFSQRRIDEQPSPSVAGMRISDVITLATGDAAKVTLSDFKIAAHEILHIMGFDSRMETDGTIVAFWTDGTPGGVLDRYLVSVNNTLYFTGPNAVAI